MNIDITRAWKEEAYRRSLSGEQLRSLPAHPSGELELTEVELRSVTGSNGSGSNGSGEFGYPNDWYGLMGGYFNSRSFFCENPVFSINQVQDVKDTPIKYTNFCANPNFCADPN